MTEPDKNKSPAERLEELLHFAQSLWLRSTRYWPVFAAGVVLASLAAWAAPKYIKPKYKSEVVLTLHERMESSALLGLQNWRESSWKTKLRELLLSGPNLRDLVQAEGLYKDWIADMGLPRTLERVRERISFTYGGETMFIISYTDDDPAIAQRAARRLGDQLTSQVSGESSDRVSATREFLQKEEGRLRTELQATELEYASFISQHPEFAPLDSAVRQTQQPAKAVVAAPSSAGQGSAAALQRQANRLRARLEQIRNPTQAPAPPPPPPPKPELTAESRAAIDAASREVKKAQDEHDLLKSRYTVRHPDVIRAEAQLNELRAQLQRIESAAWAEATATMPEAPEPVEVVVPPPTPAEEGALARQLQQVEAALHAARQPSGGQPAVLQKDDGARAIVDLETQFAELSRRQSTLRQQYALMQNRLFNANVMDKAQAVGGGTRLVVAEPAYLPSLPDARGPRRTAAAAAALFLFLGAGLMLGLGFLDQRILTAWDLTRLELAPIAVVIPPLEKESHTKAK